MSQIRLSPDRELPVRAGSLRMLVKIHCAGHDSRVSCSPAPNLPWGGLQSVHSNFQV
jgi:hypothetical protein